MKKNIKKVLVMTLCVVMMICTVISSSAVIYETDDVTITVQWNSVAQMYTLPESVEIHFYDNMDKVDATKTVTADDGWTCVVADVPIVPGSMHKFTLEATELDGYLVTIDRLSFTNYTVTYSKHDFKYAISSTDENTIVVTCTNCIDDENTSGGTATLSVANGEYTYTGEAIEPAEVTYSDDWAGGELEINYENNVNAGTATATISVGDATVSVEFEIIAVQEPETDDNAATDADTDDADNTEDSFCSKLMSFLKVLVSFIKSLFTVTVIK